MANGAFLGGIARGMNRSFPDVAGFAREERQQEETKFREAAKFQFKQNSDAADKLLEQVKAELASGAITVGDEDYQKFEQLYNSLVQNATLAGATLGIGGPASHTPETFRLATANVETEQERQQKEIDKKRAEFEQLKPLETEAAIELAEQKARIQAEKEIEVARQKKEEGLGDAGGIKSSESNSLRAAAIGLFGGDFDPLTGKVSGINPEERLNAFRVAERAEQIWMRNPGRGILGATMDAFREMRGTLPQGQETGDAATAFPSEVPVPDQPDQRQRSIDQMISQGIPADRAAELTDQRLQQTQPQTLFSETLGRVVTQQDFDDTVAETMAKNEGISRERAEQHVRERFGIR